MFILVVTYAVVHSFGPLFEEDAHNFNLVLGHVLCPNGNAALLAATT
jgi:hypothetical protein